MAIERGGEEAPTRRTLQQQPSKGREDGWKKLRKVRKAAVLSFFWDFVRKLETRTREGDQVGFYKHLKTMNLEEKRDRSSAYCYESLERLNGISHKHWNHGKINGGQKRHYPFRHPKWRYPYQERCELPDPSLSHSSLTLFTTDPQPQQLS